MKFSFSKKRLETNYVEKSYRDDVTRGTALREANKGPGVYARHFVANKNLSPRESGGLLD